jgi:hypothetical protein
VTVAPQCPLANRKFERSEPQLPMNSAARHVSAKWADFPRPICLSPAAQMPQLCTRKVSPNDARSLSHTFGKGELNLRAAQSPARRRDEPNPAQRRRPVAGLVWRPWMQGRQASARPHFPLRDLERS